MSPKSHASWLISCSLTDFAWAVESFALARFVFLSFFPQLAAVGASIVILTAPSTSTKELGGLHTGDQQSEIGPVSVTSGVTNVAALARCLAVL